MRESQQETGAPLVEVAHGDDTPPLGRLVLTRHEAVAIIDALNAANGNLRIYMWDTMRRDAAERVLDKLYPKIRE